MLTLALAGAMVCGPVRREGTRSVLKSRSKYITIVDGDHVKKKFWFLMPEKYGHCWGRDIYGRRLRLVSLSKVPQSKSEVSHQPPRECHRLQVKLPVRHQSHLDCDTTSVVWYDLPNVIETLRLKPVHAACNQLHHTSNWIG